MTPPSSPDPSTPPSPGTPNTAFAAVEGDPILLRKFVAFADVLVRDPELETVDELHALAAECKLEHIVASIAQQAEKLTDEDTVGSILARALDPAHPFPTLAAAVLRSPDFSLAALPVEEYERILPRHLYYLHAYERAMLDPASALCGWEQLADALEKDLAIDVHVPVILAEAKKQCAQTVAAAAAASSDGGETLESWEPIDEEAQTGTSVSALPASAETDVAKVSQTEDDPRPAPPEAASSSDTEPSLSKSSSESVTERPIEHLVFAIPLPEAFKDPASHDAQAIREAVVDFLLLLDDEYPYHTQCKAVPLVVEMLLNIVAETKGRPNQLDVPTILQLVCTTAFEPDVREQEGMPSLHAQLCQSLIRQAACDPSASVKTLELACTSLYAAQIKTYKTPRRTRFTKFVGDLWNMQLLTTDCLKLHCLEPTVTSLKRACFPPDRGFLAEQVVGLLFVVGAELYASKEGRPAVEAAVKTLNSKWRVSSPISWVVEEVQRRHAQKWRN